MDKKPISWQPQHPAFQALLQTVVADAAPVYVVGGVVRDHLLGTNKKLTDLDLVVQENALAVARRAANKLGWAYYAMDEARDVARLVFSAGGDNPLVCDIAGMRGPSIVSDLADRDFTINAMAFELLPNRPVTLLDNHNGRLDLEARLVRRVNATSLVTDPLRLLRAVRFAGQLGFTIEQETQDQIVRLTSALKLTSAERVRDELWKTMCVPRPDLALDELHRLGILIFVLPELYMTVDVAQSYPHYLDVFNHTALTMRFAAELRDWLMTDDVAAPSAADRPWDVPLTAAPTDWRDTLRPWRAQLQRHFLQTSSTGRLRAEWLVWFALLHDIGKPDTRTVEHHLNGKVVYRFFEHATVGARMCQQRLSELRFSRQEIALAEAVVAAHMRPHHLHASFQGTEISRRGVYRFFRDAGRLTAGDPAGVDTLLLWLADVQAIYADPPPSWDQILAHLHQMLAFVFTDQGDHDTRKRPLVDGHMLMAELELSPGPQIGQLLEQILEAQAAGEIATADDALKLAQSLLPESK